MLSAQAVTLVIVYGISLLLGVGWTVKQGAFNAPTAVGYAVTLLWLVVLVYETNCLTTGDCGAYSWLRTIMLIAIPAATVVSFPVVLAWAQRMNQQQADKAVKATVRHAS